MESKADSVKDKVQKKHKESKEAAEMDKKEQEATEKAEADKKRRKDYE